MVDRRPGRSFDDQRSFRSQDRRSSPPAAGGVFIAPAGHVTAARRSGRLPIRVRVRIWTSRLARRLPPYRDTDIDHAMSHAALLWAGRTQRPLAPFSAAHVWGLRRRRRLRPARSHRRSGIAHPRSRLVAVHRTLALPPIDSLHPRRTARARRAVAHHHRSRVRARRRVTRGSRSKARDGSASSPSTAFAIGLEQLGGPGRRGAATPHRVARPPRRHAPRASRCSRSKSLACCERRRCPTPVRQFRDRDLRPPLPARLRVAGHASVALECDGSAFHEFQRDRTRWRRLGASDGECCRSRGATSRTTGRRLSELATHRRVTIGQSSRTSVSQ